MSLDPSHTLLEFVADYVEDDLAGAADVHAATL